MCLTIIFNKNGFPQRANKADIIWCWGSLSFWLKMGWECRTWLRSILQCLRAFWGNKMTTWQPWDATSSGFCIYSNEQCTECIYCFRYSSPRGLAVTGIVMISAFSEYQPTAMSWISTLTTVCLPDKVSEERCLKNISVVSGCWRLSGHNAYTLFVESLFMHLSKLRCQGAISVRNCNVHLSIYPSSFLFLTFI